MRNVTLKSFKVLSVDDCCFFQNTMKASLLCLQIEASEDAHQRNYLQYPQRVPPSKTKPFGTAPYRRSAESFHWPMVMGGMPRVSTSRLLHRCKEAGPPSSLAPGSTPTLNLWTEGEETGSEQKLL